MKIWVHRYDLRPLIVGAPARQGVLLKVEWAAGQCGYSDLHPWPEFGEEPLEVHIQKLSSLDFTPLVEISMEANFIDRELRDLNRNAFLGLALPRSHRLVTDITAVKEIQLQQWEIDGFTHVKAKLGREIVPETQALKSLAPTTTIKWRIDLNSRMSASEFEKWWSGLGSDVQSRIDYVEDPIRQGDVEIQGPWANDWNHLPSAGIKVAKPVRENAEQMILNPLSQDIYRRLIFTHSLDHALGRAFALWSAARFYRSQPQMQEVCGLGFDGVYLPDEFTKEWDCSGPRLKPPTGTGFGFDEILKALKWERLV